MCDDTKWHWRMNNDVWWHTMTYDDTKWDITTYDDTYKHVTIHKDMWWHVKKHDMTRHTDVTGWHVWHTVDTDDPPHWRHSPEWPGPQGHTPSPLPPRGMGQPRDWEVTSFCRCRVVTCWCLLAPSRRPWGSQTWRTGHCAAWCPGVALDTASLSTSPHCRPVTYDTQGWH